LSKHYGNQWRTSLGGQLTIIGVSQLNKWMKGCGVQTGANAPHVDADRTNPNAAVVGTSVFGRWLKRFSVRRLEWDVAPLVTAAPHPEAGEHVV
jgi:hypothetical protein